MTLHHSGTPGCPLELIPSSPFKKLKHSPRKENSTLIEVQMPEPRWLDLTPGHTDSQLCDVNHVSSLQLSSFIYKVLIVVVTRTYLGRLL